MATPVKIEVFPGRDSKWYYRPIEGNGRQIFQSQGYSTKWNAKRAAKSVFPEVEPIIVNL